MKSSGGFSSGMVRWLAAGVGRYSLMIALWAGPGAVMAAPTFTVNTVSDAGADPADTDYSVCRTAANNSTCTLRAAIMKANHYAGGGVTINIPANALPYKLTTLPTGADDETTGDLNILQSMTINGARAGSTIIDGNVTDRLFHIQANGGTVNISGVTLRNGKTSQVGGGIYLQTGGLNLSNSTVSGNSGYHGGGIFTNGTSASSTFTNVTTTLNTSSFLGGGICNNGSQLLTLNNCVITDNTAGTDGAGVWCNFPTTLNNCRLSGNHAQQDGGGVGNDVNTTLLINNSTLNANSAVRNGGALFTNFGTTTLNNSTLSANGAQSYGGGIFNDGSTTSTFFCTIAGNIGDTDANGGSTGGIWNQSGSVQIWNTLLAENYTNGVENDISGAANVTSQDYNYVQNGNSGLSGSTTHNVYGGDILLDGLQGNGASATPTRALLVGSPALDQIPAALCRDSFGTAPIPDERSVARPVGSNGDMGAYEGSVQPIYNRNLIRNGDAENGAGSPTGVRVGTPNWVVPAGQFTTVPYNSPGGFPNTATDPVPAQHGYNFFSGGNAALSQGTQTIDVSIIGAKIDGGNQAYTFSGDFGGYAAEADAATAHIAFLDGSHSIIGSAQFGPFDPSDRGSVTGFKNHSASGLLPVGTRFLDVTVSMIRSMGTANDGYIDNVSLVLSAPLLGNISTRSFVQTGDNVMIGGFVVKVGSPKKVIIRAIGPSLANFGVANPLQNPTLELHSGNTTIASNDNWGDAANHQEISNSGFAPSNSLESAILMTLNPGAYTAIVSGVNNGTGVGVIEGYDLDRTAISKFGDISTRSFVQTGENVMIGGFVVSANGSKKVIVRALGPSLSNLNVPNPLPDPTLELHDANGATIASNDNWGDTQQAQIQATGFAPSNDAESATVQTLAPGSYTAIVAGKDNTTGVALVEVYGLN